MKTLKDIIKATEARGAQVVVETANGKAGDRGCLAIVAFAGTGAERAPLTTTMVGPDMTIDDANFDYYVADLDDPKTSSSSGLVKPAA